MEKMFRFHREAERPGNKHCTEAGLNNFETEQRYLGGCGNGLQRALKAASFGNLLTRTLSESKSSQHLFQQPLQSSIATAGLGKGIAKSE